MSMQGLARRIKFLFHREQFANELDEEMRLHLDLRAQRLREFKIGRASCRERV